MTITAAETRETELARRRALLDEWVALEGEIARLQARQAVLLAERMDALADDPDIGLQGGDVCLRSLAAEYGAAAHIPPSTAAARLTDAWVLTHRFPATLAAFADGRISRRHVDVILTESPEPATDQDASLLRQDYEAQVVPFAEHDTAARTRAHARGVATALAPDRITASHRRGRARRMVSVTPDGDGMALLTALLPEIEAYAIKDRLDALARRVAKSAREADAAPTHASSTISSAYGRDPAAESSIRSDEAPPGVIDIVDLGLFSVEAEAFERRLSDSEPAPWDPCARICPPADAVWIGGDPDIPALDAEFEALVAALQDGIPVDPFPPPPERLYTGDHSLPQAPLGILEHDDRTMDQIRADVFADMLLTADPSLCTRSGLEAIRATVQVTIKATTLLGQDDRAAELDGIGPIDPEWVRQLAGCAPSLDRLFLDHAGMVTATDSYTPTMNMKRFLRARDQHCRFPGCRRPAHVCQHDHNLDHAKGGPTDTANLALFCTGHHPLKRPDLDDDTRWTARQLAGGLIEWTSPLGRSYVDRPPARVMFV